MQKDLRCALDRVGEATWQMQKDGGGKRCCRVESSPFQVEEALMHIFTIQHSISKSFLELAHSG